MPHTNVFDQVRSFRRDSLNRVTTTVTVGDGQQYVESFQDCGFQMLHKKGRGNGYVLDNKADITVSLIMAGLVLGSQDVATELKILEDLNVTHILNVGYRIPNYFESKFIYKNVEILDDPSTDIRIFFEGCFEFIDDGRHAGCVLVHCNAGVSRAPTIVIAYLMNRYKKTLKEAHGLVKSVRSIVRPNDGFMRVLQQYDQELANQSK